MTNKAEKKVFVNTLVEFEMNKKLQEIADDLRISRSEVVRLAIEEFLERYYDNLTKFVLSKTIKSI